MPSLRRTFSSPVVRSSPYPSSSPSSALQNSSRAQGGHGHRRSLGSETSNRRVLADIEWWRVADGQRLDQGNDDYAVDGDRNTGHGEWQGSILAIGPDSSSDNQVITEARQSMVLPALPVPPTDRFAELSIRPRTPDHDDNDSAPPSLLATPESVCLPLGGLTLGYGNPGGPSSNKRPYRSVTMPVFPTKTKLFDDLFNDIGDINPAGPYADFSISPLSSTSPLLLN